MTNEVDEGLIEETIRRVAQQKAKLASAAAKLPEDVPAPASGEAEVPASTQDANSGADEEEDRIAATIRRVAEQKAAMTAAGSAAERPADEDVAQSEDTTEPSAEVEVEPVQPAPADEEEEEDPIEATIRRVAAQKAARAQQAEDDWEDDAEPAKPPVVAQPAASHADEDWSPRPLRAVAGNYSPAAAAASPAQVEDVLTNAAYSLASLVSRLEAVLPALERIAASGATAQTSRPNLVPERPQIFKDMPASAQSEPDRIDTRPIPKPLPPLQADTRRGFDLLPRTYRITVEDKRRGVDLVPLHRALLGMDGVRDMSLLSYNNGIAIVSLVTTTDIAPDALAAVVSRAMSRDARVEQHNELTLVVKLAED